jgi:5'-nucleotidase
MFPLEHMKRQKKLHVLISNDDGIDAPGLHALVSEVKTFADVTVVAPDRQQSAVGHAITMNFPLRVMPYSREGKFYGYAVQGTPADAVKLGVGYLLKRPPDLVLSGVNHGSNTAISVIYSGTVSAATEGTVLGIPSMAISLTTHGKADFTYAAKFGARLARLVAKRGLPLGTLLNVNVPAVPPSRIRGVRVTRQGASVWNDAFEVRRDPANREYFWLTGRLKVTDTKPDVDEVAVRQRYVSVTPIRYDLTDRKMLVGLKKWKLEDLR